MAESIGNIPKSYKTAVKALKSRVILGPSTIITSSEIACNVAKRMVQMQRSRNYAATIKEVRTYLEGHFSNPNLSLDYLSEVFHIQPKYLSKLFKEETGQKFVDFLIGLRMQHAHQLLATTVDSVQDIAEKVGYTSAISFRRVFKKVIGVSPSGCRGEHLLFDLNFSVE